MNSNLIRQKFLDFYTARGHAVIPSAPLVPENDPTTLFTSSGMQPLVPYLLGQPHPSGKRLVNSQKSFRAQDIEEVGDNRHTTFFEMLGNWSLGDYFKKEQLAWFWEFLTKVLDLPPQHLYVSVFEGNDQVSKDDESAQIWQSLGVPKDHIFYYGVDKNWWSRSGPPENMPAGEPGGPDTEVFYEFEAVKHNPKFGKTCHPNCDCGRFLEIGNSVFMQYQKQSDGSLTELPQKNVDFGGGLERLAAATANNPDVFKIDLMAPVVHILEASSGSAYLDKTLQKSFRIITDHMRAALFMIGDGIIPSNTDRGYILRRLIRRTVPHLDRIHAPQSVVTEVFKSLSTIYEKQYPEVSLSRGRMLVTILTEVNNFREALTRGMREFTRFAKDGSITAKDIFELFTTHGLPVELIVEEAVSQGIKEIDLEGFRELMKKHQELSRAGSEQKFKGGLADQSETVVKYHTATHLLHQALRDVLGNHVQQKGSNITSERLRFDFSHPEPLTPDEINQVETIVNTKIKADLPVTRIEMSKTKALSEGALAFFPEKYPSVTSVYTIGDYSKELCGGPHVTSTAMIGPVKINKVESIGGGVKRVYVTAKPDH